MQVYVGIVDGTRIVHYTTEEMARAAMEEDLHNRLGHPSDLSLTEALNAGYGVIWLN